MEMKMKYEELKDERPIEEVVTDYAKFMNDPETKKFLDDWKKKGFKKIGIAELLFKLLILSGSSRSKKELLKDAQEIMLKLKGEGGCLSFLSELKLTPEKINKQA